MLLAFKSKTLMFKIEPTGSNKNDGVIIDSYTSRRTVSKFEDYIGKQITETEFKKYITKLFEMTITKIITS